MSAPVIVVDEYNGPSPGVQTQAIASLVFASIDANSNTPNLVTNTIPPATNSYEKWLQLRVQSAAPSTLTNVKLVFSAVAPTDSTGAASLSVLYGAGASYPTFGPTMAASTTAVNPTLNNSLVIPLDNVDGATSVFITLQLQASLGAQPGAFNFPSDFYVVVFDWT
jgi:hypothetical protein